MRTEAWATEKQKRAEFGPQENLRPKFRSSELWLTATAFGSGFAFAVAATLVKTVNASGSIDNALFAGVKRMAIGAQIEAHFGHSGVSCDIGAARGATDIGLHVIWVNFWFHVGKFGRSGQRGLLMRRAPLWTDGSLMASDCCAKKSDSRKSPSVSARIIQTIFYSFTFRVRKSAGEVFAATDDDCVPPRARRNQRSSPCFDGALTSWRCSRRTPQADVSMSPSRWEEL